MRTGAGCRRCWVPTSGTGRSFGPSCPRWPLPGCPPTPTTWSDPGIAIDETAHLKHGDATACVAPQHARCTGKVENCVTTVFSAYVTADAQAWADFDVYMPERWADDQPRRDAAGIPTEVRFATKPQLATRQLRRLTAAGLPARWVAFDEVYGRSEELRKTAARAGLAYVAIIPCDYQVTTPAGTTIRAEQAVPDAIFQRRSCGYGSKGPRYSDWAMTATNIPGQHLLIRRLISRPDQYTFYLCWAPPDRPATITYFITIAGRRWPVEETFKTGKDVLGWDQSQARTWTSIHRHTALTALAQLRCAATRATPTPHPTTPSVTPTCTSLSATRPCPTTADNPARPASPPSNCLSPKPPDSHDWLPSTPPDSSAGHAWPSRCAGHNDADATKLSPAGITTAPDSSPQHQEPGSQPQPKGGN